jgi:two-component system response regulator QseB
MAQLLLVEDDELLRDGLQAQLQQAGHHITLAEDGQIALDHLAQTAFEGVVLDLGLPRVDGLSVLRQLRQTQTALPVLILTARDGVEDRVAGLNAGADDYLTKPFSMDELLARLHALLRRSRLPAVGPVPLLASPQADTPDTRLRLDPELPRAWLDGEAIELTRREWVLLELLLNPDKQVVSREAVIAAWQADEPGEAGANSNALEVYVHRVRRKLAQAPIHIRNIRGLGYLLEWHHNPTP